MVPGLDLLRTANKVVPETRIVWAAIAVVAALAIIESFRLGWSVAALGAVVVLVLLILFFVVSGVCGYLADPIKGNSLLKYPAIVLTWAFTLGICVFVGLSLSCFFIGKPKTLVELFTFSGPIVEVEKDKATEGPATVTALPPRVSPSAASTAARQPTRADSVNLCLSAINSTQLSVSEVQAAARQCLRAP